MRNSILVSLLLPATNTIAFAPSTLTSQWNGVTATTNTITTSTFVTPAESVNTEIAESSDERTPEEDAFFAKTKELCCERNYNLSDVKNARDLSTARNSPIKPNRILRTGRVSDASSADQALLFGEIGVRTLIDLRSPTELKDDPTLDREEVFGDFTSLIWDERDNGIVKELKDDQSIMRSKRTIMGHVKELVGGAKSGVDAATHPPTTETDTQSGPQLLIAAADLASITTESETDGKLIIEADVDETLDHDRIEEGKKSPPNKRFVKLYQPGTLEKDLSRNGRKERHFVSIMNELKYVRGTLSKVRKRDIGKVIMKSPGAIVSKRVRSSIKKPFLTKINAGGLPMLNELLLRFGAPGIKHVLDICKDRSRHPVAFYCTAGKDRTGIIAAIMLAVVGVAEEDIVEDYSLSANVYAEMNDHTAMVGALSQRSLDAKTFLGAPPHVMREVLANIKEDYGSMEGYLDWIGFDEEDRAQLKSALLDE